MVEWRGKDDWYQGSRNEAATLDDVDDQCHVHEWGDDGIPDEPFLADPPRHTMSLTDWERQVVRIAESHGLVYERPTGGRNHGKMRDPITDKFRPVSCSPRDEGRAAIHVNNDARRLVALRPAAPTTNGDTPEPVAIVEPELTDEQLDELTTPDPVVAPAVAPKRRIVTRGPVLDKRKRQLLDELGAKVREIDELEQWQRERRAEADQLVGRGRKLGISMPAMAEAAGRSTPWIQTCLRRVAGVEPNQRYGEDA